MEIIEEDQGFIASIPFHYKVIFTVFSFCQILALVISRVILSRFPSYQNATKTTKRNWHIRLVAAIHAAIIALLSLTIIIRNRHLLFTDPIWSKAEGTQLLLSVVIGYMLSDLVLITLYNWEGWKIGIPDIIHHVGTMIVSFTVLKYEYIEIVSVVRAFAELSTPFIHIRWYMLKSDLTDKWYYLGNGIIILLMFTFCRIIPMPYLYYTYFAHYSEVNKLGFLKALMVFGMATDFLNLMWFTKIVKLLTRYIGKPKHE